MDARGGSMKSNMGRTESGVRAFAGVSLLIFALGRMVTTDSTPAVLLLGGLGVLLVGTALCRY